MCRPLPSSPLPTWPRITYLSHPSHLVLLRASNLPLLTHARTIQIPEVAELDSLHLDFQSISDIYLNKIKMWNHPNLTALNPSLNLPNQTITVFYISVPSVVMQVLSMTLSQTVPEWNERVRLEFPG